MVKITLTRLIKNIIWTGFLLIASCRAGNVTVSLSCDEAQVLEDPDIKKSYPTVFVGEPFTLAVKVESDQGVSIQNCLVSGVDKFDCYGTSQQQSFVQINGRASHSANRLITYQSSQEGLFTLGPARVTVDGVTHQSNSFAVRVRKRSQQDRPVLSSRKRHGPQAKDKEVIAELEIAEKEVLIGQPVLATVRFSPASRLIDLTGFEAPELEDFYVKTASQAQRKVENIDGHDREFFEAQFLLIPKSIGVKHVKPFKISYLSEDTLMRSFFFTSHSHAKTNAAVLEVKQLPSYSGQIDAVGEVKSVELKFEKTKLTLNEPVKALFIVNGLLDLEHLDVPALVLPEGFKSYESTAEVHENKRNLLEGGSKEFSFVVQGSKVGEFVIKSQSFTYFDTLSSTVKKIMTQPITIAVAPSAHDAPDNELSSQDIKDTHEEPSSNQVSQESRKRLIELESNFPRSRHKNGWNFKGLSWLLFLMSCMMPVMIFGCIPAIKVLLRRYRERAESLRLLKDRIGSELRDAAVEHNDAILYFLFMKYFSQKYGVSQPLISEEWIEHRLQQEQWTSTKIEHFLQYLHGCARLAYTGLNHDAEAIKKLKTEGLRWLDELEK